MKQNKILRIIWLCLLIFWCGLLAVRMFLSWGYLGEPLDKPLQWLFNILWIFISGVQFHFWNKRCQNTDAE